MQSDLLTKEHLCSVERDPVSIIITMHHKYSGSSLLRPPSRLDQRKSKG